MIKLYERIGHASGEHAYDTEAAQDAIVRREIAVR